MGGKLPLGVLTGVALAIALGVAGALWAQSGGSAGDTAKLVPAHTVAYITINTDPASRQWVQMAQLLGRLDLLDTLKEARNSGLGFANLDWEQDIAPFLGGEATIAVTNVRIDEPGLLVILSTTDGNKAWQTARKALENVSTRATPEIRTYRGTEIRTYRQGEFSLPVSVTHKDRYLIIATGPEQAQQVLDLHAGQGESLAGLERFRKARAAVTADPLIFTYINPTALGSTAEQLSGLFSPFGTVSGTEQALREAGMENAALAFAASAERAGVKFEWQAVGIDGSKTPIVLPAAPEESRLARRAPADTLLFANAMNLSALYQGVRTVVDRLAADPQTENRAREFTSGITELKRDLGFDFEKEFIAHLTGEYALALGTTALQTDNLWVLAMSAVSNPQSVSRALDLMTAYARRKGERVSAVTIGGVAMTEIRPRTGNDGPLTYGVTGDELLMAYGPNAMQNALGSKQTLAESADYREAMGLLPKGRVAAMYLNLAHAIAMLRDADSGFIGAPRDWQALTKLRYLVAGATQSDDRIGGVAFLRIAE